LFIPLYHVRAGVSSSVELALYTKNYSDGTVRSAVVFAASRDAAISWQAERRAQVYAEYRQEREKDSFSSAYAVYIRPFMYSGGGVGVKLSTEPWAVIVCTTVSAYFESGLKGAVVNERTRATPKGTGWIKAASQRKDGGIFRRKIRRFESGSP
jgi:branched-subunit amino acid aminotransferase/4-amino-4-deoxychorismate lyase